MTRCMSHDERAKRSVVIAISEQSVLSRRMAYIEPNKTLDTVQIWTRSAMTFLLGDIDMIAAFMTPSRYNGDHKHAPCAAQRTNFGYRKGWVSARGSHRDAGLCGSRATVQGGALIRRRSAYWPWKSRPPAWREVEPLARCTVWGLVSGVVHGQTSQRRACPFCSVAIAGSSITQHKTRLLLVRTLVPFIARQEMFAKRN